ncbi:MAG TPA: GAF domain-containing protein [Acetobacteraceae bacterium]|nr:GAF domain-containing protein [Acetobacteraceae bacterium]
MAALGRQRLVRRLGSIGLVDEVFLQYANILTEIRTFPPNGDAQTLGGKVDQFLDHTLNRIAVLFSTYTGRHAHVSLKLLDGPKKQVRTIARDQTSVANRGAIDETLGWFPYADNTAFNHILTDPGAKYFLSNHLRVMALFGRYKNIRPDWKQYYRACLVVPITLSSHGAAIHDGTVWGFLTVDNRGGGFDATCSCALLQSFARMYYSVLGELSTIPAADIMSTARASAANSRGPSQ